MKILFVTTGDIKSIATSKRALGLANPLSELGWDVSILMEDTTENRHRYKMECNEHIKVHYFPHCSMFKERKYKNELINTINPDYLYICAFVTRNIVGIRHKSKKIVEHSELQSSIPNLSKIRKAYEYLCECYSIFYSDGILNASMYLNDVLKKRAHLMHRSYIPMLYYPYAFNPDTIKVLNIDFENTKYSRFCGKFNFVFLGSVTKNYGVFTILDAVVKLLRFNNNFQMLILGKGPDYDVLKAKVKEKKLEPYVYMPGYIKEEEISEYFSLASAFVSPMNNTVQDWARCPSKMYLYLPYNKPIITCKIGEPYQILKNKGFYYSSGDSSDLARQMNKVINQGFVSMNVNSDLHSWTTRAIDFDNWIRTSIL